MSHPQEGSFKYLGSTIQENGEMAYHIVARWMKQRLDLVPYVIRMRHGDLKVSFTEW